MTENETPNANDPGAQKHFESPDTSVQDAVASIDSCIRQGIEAVITHLESLAEAHADIANAPHRDLQTLQAEMKSFLTRLEGSVAALIARVDRELPVSRSDCQWLLDKIDEKHLALSNRINAVDLRRSDTRRELGEKIDAVDNRLYDKLSDLQARLFNVELALSSKIFDRYLELSAKIDAVRYDRKH